MNILIHKLRQAMSPWYLHRQGFYGRLESSQGARSALWRARGRALAHLLRRYGRRLPKLLFGADDNGVPPPRV